MKRHSLVLQGAPGESLDADKLRGMEAFLSADSPRVRLLGGTRFDGSVPPSPEWASFGTYCFLLPRLELLEAAGCCLLSCTIAWMPSCGPSERSVVLLDLSRPTVIICWHAEWVHLGAFIHLTCIWTTLLRGCPTNAFKATRTPASLDAENV